MNILVVRISAIGDVIATLPAVLKLRSTFPQARLGWLVQKKAADILLGQPWIDDLYILEDNFWHLNQIPATLSQLSEINRVGWHIIIDFQGNEKTTLLRSFLSGVHLGAHPRHARSLLGGLFLDYQIPLQTAHVGTQHLELVDALADLHDIPTDYYSRVRAHALYQLPAYTENLVQQWQHEHTLTPQSYILLHPNTTWPSKHWPTAYWLELIDLLNDAHHTQGLPQPVLVGAHLRGQASEIASLCSDTITRTPAWDLATIARAQTEAALVIAPDTGLLHYADFLGVPTIGLFGPTQATRNGPWLTPGNEARTLQVACSHQHQKSHGAIDCMAQLSSAEVFETVCNFLQNDQPLFLPSFLSHNKQGYEANQDGDHV